MELINKRNKQQRHGNQRHGNKGQTDRDKRGEGKGITGKEWEHVQRTHGQGQ